MISARPTKEPLPTGAEGMERHDWMPIGPQDRKQLCVGAAVPGPRQPSPAWLQEAWHPGMGLGWIKECSHTAAAASGPDVDAATHSMHPPGRPSLPQQPCSSSIASWRRTIWSTPVPPCQRPGQHTLRTICSLPTTLLLCPCPLQVPFSCRGAYGGP
jgi:hypothetical protein